MCKCLKYVNNMTFRHCYSFSRMVEQSLTQNESLMSELTSIGLVGIDIRFGLTLFEREDGN